MGELCTSYRPSEDEPYMGARQRAYFRGRLTEMREAILGETPHSLGALRTQGAGSGGDEADRAQHETECSLRFLVEERQARTLKAIRRALERLDNGSFGFCGETGEPIGLSRLEANPLAELTVEAQTRAERSAQVRAAV